MPDISAFMREGGPCAELNRRCKTTKDNPGCACVVAADEIDRLRVTVMNLSVSHGKLSDENDELREERRRLRVEAGYD